MSLINERRQKHYLPAPAPHHPAPEQVGSVVTISPRLRGCASGWDVGPSMKACGVSPVSLTSHFTSTAGAAREEMATCPDSRRRPSPSGPAPSKAPSAAAAACYWEGERGPPAECPYVLGSCQGSWMLAQPGPVLDAMATNWH